jgi:hypothetical protein
VVGGWMGGAEGGGSLTASATGEGGEVRGAEKLTRVTWLARGWGFFGFGREWGAEFGGAGRGTFRVVDAGALEGRRRNDWVWLMS